MTALVEKDPVLAEVLSATLGDSVTLLRSVEALEAHLRSHPAEYAAVLGPSISDEAAATFAGHHRIARPALGVILVRPAVDSTVLADALRSGMSEVVETGDATGLRDAVHRATEVGRAVSEGLDQSAEPQRRGSLVTVFSTKGGVGKSLVATNVAVALADAGQRVCVVDLDIHCGDVAIMLQLTPLHTLADLERLSDSIDVSGVESLLTEHSERLSVLAAPVQLGSPVPAEPMGSLLDILKQLFDVVVVDTSGMFDDYVLPALDLSEVVVLVGTLDIPSLKSLKLAAGTLDLLNLPRERWRLVINRADAKVGLSAGEFEETLGLKADLTLPSSRDVLAAVNRGEAIVRANRGHQVSKAITAFAESLAEALSASPTEPAAADAGSHSRRGAPRRGLRIRKVA
ncbi:AAA family ATPase [Nocardioides sp. MAHUQ-72]|uniref:AAA family ATPase n=1 Tax=unclassified Nocardioides TaxID=2615069 RepID=UPI00361CA263